MIKFFRKIRQHLLAENKFSKYLIYAIGEIVLVVIGILIALQINNKNEARKQSENYMNILRTIQNDMKVDTVALNYVIKFYEDREYAYHLSMEDTITKEEYLKCKYCPPVLSGFQSFSIQKRGYNQFQSHNSNEEFEADSLNLKLSVFYLSMIEDIELGVTFNIEVIFDHLKDIRDSKIWFKDWYENKYTDDFYNYATTNPYYKNRVSQSYALIYKYYLSILRDAKLKEEEILSLIEKRLEDTN